MNNSGTWENHLIRFNANSIRSWSLEGEVCDMKKNMSCKVSGAEGSQGCLHNVKQDSQKSEKVLAR